MTRRRDVALAGHLGDETTARAGLSDSDAMVRATAVTALARLARLTMDDLRSASSDADPRVRGRVAEAAIAAPTPADAYAVIAPLLADPDATVVEVAAWACGEVESVDAAIVAALCELTTGHDDALVREAAVAALGAIGDDRGLPAIF